MNPNYKVHDPKGWGGDPSRGAALGRPTVHAPDHEGFEGQLLVSRVPIDSGGYDPNGTYYGTGDPLFWARNEDLTVDYTFRAKDRETAVRLVFMEYPSAAVAQTEENYLDDMVASYLRTILFAENDESTPSGGEPLDRSYEISDFAPESVEKARKDCETFYIAAGEHLPSDPDRVGYHFWLTRQGHGAGFWDGDYPKEQGDALTAAAERSGERNVYVGDDKKIYVE